MPEWRRHGQLQIVMDRNQLSSAAFDINWLFLSVPDLIMEYKQFKEFAKDMVDYIGDYLENIRDRYILLYMYVLCG